MAATNKEEAFLKFHSTHPEVFERFAQVALFMVYRGDTRVSANTIFNEMGNHRSDFNRELGLAPMKFNNHFRPFYARICLERYPELAGVLVVKKPRVVDEDMDRNWIASHRDFMTKVAKKRLAAITDPVQRARLLKEFIDEDTRAYEEASRNFFHRHTTRARAQRAAPAFVTPDKAWQEVIANCQLLEMEPPPSFGPADLDLAKKRLRSIQKNYHPDKFVNDPARAKTAAEYFSAAGNAHFELQEFNKNFTSSRLAESSAINSRPSQ